MFKKLLNIKYLNTYVSKRQAGHSKWANIKHTKTLKDDERSRVFTKFSQQIKVAIQEGKSTNPELNLKLEQIIKQARRMSMPAATIENVIKSTQKDKTQMKNFTFEIKGPGASMIICEVISPNIIKTKNDISTIMKKHLCKYSDGGGRHLFEHKGIIKAKLLTLQDTKTLLEVATNHAIECEAEDVEISDSAELSFLCDPRNFTQVQKKLEQFDYEIIDANLEYIPNVAVSLNESDLKTCMDFLNKLQDMNDVFAVFHNIEQK